MSGSIPFTIQPQQQTEWCWAAVSVSVDHYFNAASAWTQCLIANNQLNQSNCCTNGSDPQCDCPWYLDRALSAMNRLRVWLQSPAGFSSVKQEINQSDPLCARIGWSGGGGHFVAISAYDDTTSSDYITVNDPIWGVSQIPYNVFLSNYRGNGSWTDSYYTQ